jgi:signal transduction histidine kinase
MSERDRAGSSTVPSLARHLASELRLPLAALMRLGRRCAESDERDLAAAGRAIARECERLDVVVANTLEFGLLLPEPPVGRTDVLEVVEKAIASQRALIEGLAIHVRVYESAGDAVLAAERDELIELFSALFSDLVERMPRRARIDVRVREVLGIVRIDCSSAAAQPAPGGERPALARAEEIVARLNGEWWELTEDEQGFGLALPRAPAAR